MTSLTQPQKESFYEMANLFPKHTGLPFVVWVSIQGGARHDVRVKVSPGPKAQAANLISVGIRPNIHVIEDTGEMSAADFNLLTHWIEVNRETIIQYWNGEIDTIDLAAAIRSL